MLGKSEWCGDTVNVDLWRSGEQEKWLVGSAVFQVWFWTRVTAEGIMPLVCAMVEQCCTSCWVIFFFLSWNAWLTRGEMKGRETTWDDSSSIGWVPKHAVWDVYVWILGQCASEITLIVTLSMTAMALLASGSHCGREGVLQHLEQCRWCMMAFRFVLSEPAVSLTEEKGQDSWLVHTETFAQTRKKLS